jgi:hypothetical protein
MYTCTRAADELFLP